MRDQAMNKREHQDTDDDFGEDSLFEDEESRFEHAHKRRKQRPPTRSPNGFEDGDASRSSDKPTRHREFATLEAWGTPY